MKARRRIILQLTPLLDLLLVVIFAQYMDLQSTSERMVRREQRRRRETQFVSARLIQQERAAREKTQREAQLRIARAENDLRRAEQLRDEALTQMKAVNERIKPLQRLNQRLTREQEALKKQADSLAKELAERSKEVETLAKKLNDKEAQERIARAKARREAEERARLMAERDLDAIGEIVRGLLNDKDGAVREVLQGRPAQQTSKILGELKALQNVQDPSAIVQHLRKTVELKKRCDFWEIHLYDNGSARVVVKGKVIEPRLLFTDAAELTRKFVDLIKREEDPKGLVIVFVTYGDPQWGTLQKFKKGLDDAIAILDASWKGVRRVHVARWWRLSKPPGVTSATTQPR